MTRDEVVKGLESVATSHNLPITGHEVDAAREAIALLTPPTTDEIGAARSLVKASIANGTYQVAEWKRWRGALPDDAQVFPTLEQREMFLAVHVTLDRALDALAREPGTESTLHRKNCRIAELEARLARVRELRRAVNPHPCHSSRCCRDGDLDECGYCAWEAENEDALDAALAADAEPAQEPR